MTTPSVPNDRVVYSGRVTNWPLFWLVNALAVPLFALSGFPHTPWAPTLATAAFFVLLNLVITSLRTTAGPNGVVVRYGVFGLPRFRYPAAAIARAEAIDVPLSRLGGLGIHWSPWRGTRLTVRTGPTLQLHLVSGKDVTISADDPAAAVAVINAQAPADH
jgi:hypothetical protein